MNADFGKFRATSKAIMATTRNLQALLKGLMGQFGQAETTGIARYNERLFRMALHLKDGPVGNWVMGIRFDEKITCG